MKNQRIKTATEPETNTEKLANDIFASFTKPLETKKAEIEANPQIKAELPQTITEKVNEIGKEDEYMKMLGQGGTIYVHVLGIPNQAITGEQEDVTATTKINKKHFEEAVKLSNERFAKMDVNLKVVLVWDLGKKPLTKEEFQQRKADPNQRKTMKEEFNQPYNITDSYVIVNTEIENQQHQYDLTKNPSENDWTQWDYIPENPKEKANQKIYGGNGNETNTTNNLIGLSAGAEQFVAFINSDKLAIATTLFLDSHPEIANQTKNLPAGTFVDANRTLGKSFDNIASQTISALIEHETGHNKFDFYSRNERQYQLKNNVQERVNNRTIFGTDISERMQGHVDGTIMDKAVSYEDFNNLSISYDEYMKNLLKLLHGTKNGKVIKQSDLKELEVSRLTFSSFAKHLKAALDKANSEIEQQKLLESYLSAKIQMEKADKAIEAFADIQTLIKSRFENGDLKNAKTSK